MATLNERIKEMRLKRGYTQLEVAAELGVTSATIQRYESGVIPNIPHKAIVNLAEMFNCLPSYLMGWDDELKEPITIPPILNDVQVAFCGELLSGLDQSDIDMLVMLVKRMKQDHDAVPRKARKKRNHGESEGNTSRTAL